MDVTKTTQNSKVNVRLIVGTGMLSALAFVLQYLEFPIPIMPGFIKFDFSDLPALIGAFAYGPIAGILVEFIKNLLHCTVTQSFTVGELSNFIMIISLVKYYNESVLFGQFYNTLSLGFPPSSLCFC